jgi:hypothetical protein
MRYDWQNGISDVAGPKMSKLIFVAQVVLGIAFFLTTLPAYAEDACGLSLMAQLPVRFDSKTGEPLITLTAGTQTLTLVINTEAPFSALSREAVAKVDGEIESMDQLNIGLASGGKQLKSFAKVKNIIVGQLRLSKFDFPMLPASAPPRNNDGFIGVDFLSNYDVEFDFLNSRMNLFVHYDCNGRPPVYWTDAYGESDLVQNRFNYIIFPTALNGSEVPTILGTAYRLTSMPRDIASRRFGVRPSETGSVCTTDTPHGDKFVQLDVGGLSIHNPEINSDCGNPLCPTSETDAPQLGIGGNHLKKLRIFVAWKQHKIYFSPSVASS